MNSSRGFNYGPIKLTYGSSVLPQKILLELLTFYSQTALTLVLLKPGMPVVANSIDPDLLASSEAN